MHEMLDEVLEVGGQWERHSREVAVGQLDISADLDPHHGTACPWAGDRRCELDRRIKLPNEGVGSFTVIGSTPRRRNLVEVEGVVQLGRAYFLAVGETALANDKSTGHEVHGAAHSGGALPELRCFCTGPAAVSCWLCV